MSDRIRFALLTFVVLACFSVRAGGAMAAKLHEVTHISRATVVAHRRARVVRFARRFLGVRYVYGGSSPGTGFDCSGFTRFVYSHFGVALHRAARPRRMAADREATAFAAARAEGRSAA